MRTEKVLWWLAVGCAVLLLLAPFTPRTTWLPTARSAGASRGTEGVGWLAIAALLGTLVLVALVVAIRARQRIPAATAGAGVAAVTFVVTAVGLGRHWIDLRHGVTSVRMQPGEQWALHPAPFVPHFSVVAAAGAVVALALLVRWVRPTTGTGAGHAARSRPLPLRGDRPEPAQCRIRTSPVARRTLGTSGTSGTLRGAGPAAGDAWRRLGPSNYLNTLA